MMRSSDLTSPVVFRRSLFGALRSFIAIALFKRLTRVALPLFVRGGDIISAPPQALGAHEPQVAHLLERFAADGHRDFLIDVGANIGLISCQSGSAFGRVVMFEPNPLCVGILKVNSAIALDQTPHEVHPFGLGTNNEVLTLRVPKHNWGGAYVVSNDNTYDSSTLLQKDGLVHDDPAKYLTMDIEIRDAVQVFSDLFGRLLAAGARHGAVKIDVEGLEWVVLLAISKSLPTDISLYIAFEHWGGAFLPAPLLEAFGGRAELFALVKTPSGARTAIGKLFDIVVRGGQQFALEPWSADSDANDLVLRVHPRGERA